MILVDHRSSLTGSTTGSSICLNFPKIFNSVELQSLTVYTSDVCSTPCCDTGIGMSDGFALGFNKLSRGTQGNDALSFAYIHLQYTYLRNSISYSLQTLFRIGHGQNLRKTILEILTVFFFLETNLKDKNGIFNRFVTKLTQSHMTLVWSMDFVYLTRQRRPGLGLRKKQVFFYRTFFYR